MYRDLFENMSSIALSKPISRGVNTELFKYPYIESDGIYHPESESQILCKLNNGDVIYECNDLHLVQSVTISVLETDSEIKLNYIDGTGKNTTVRPKIRTPEQDEVIYTFEVKDTPLKIEIIIPDSNSYSLLRVGATGVGIELITKVIELTGNLYKEIRGEEGILKKQISEDISQLRSDKIEISNELKSLQETNKRLQETNKRLHETTNLEENQLQQTRERVESLRDELSILNDDIKNSNEKLLEQKKNLRDNDRKIKENSDSIENKKTEVEELNEKLKNYKEKASLYSEDFSTFKEEVTTQNNIYYSFLFLSLVIITIVSYQLYMSALSTVDNFQFNFDLWTLLVSRLPIITINLFILGSLTSVIYFLINIIITNNNNIAKTKQISYLVKECIDSQRKGLENLNEEEILKQRVESKMELIKTIIISNLENDNNKIDKKGIKDMVHEFIKKESSSKEEKLK